MATKAADQVTLQRLATPTNVRAYYLKQASTLSPPAKPTVHPPAAPWTTTEPAYTEGSTDTLYTVMVSLWGDGTYQYGDVQKSASFEAAKQAYNKAVAAGNAAAGALHVANLAAEFAEGLVDMSPEQPVNPPVGQVWIPTNEQGQGTGVSRWNGEAWETVTNLVGLLIVPTEDGGQTLVGPDGVDTPQVLADLIRTKVLYVEEAGVETLVVTGIPRENLAGDVNKALGTAEDLGSRIILDGQAGTLTIARNKDADSTALTALRLSATNLDFISAGEVAAYIDATRNQFFIRNAYIQDTLQIGEHQVRRLGQNNITVFQWVGV